MFPDSIVRFCLTAFLPLSLAAAEPATDVSLPPGADVAEIVFDKEPVERGLTFDRAGWKPGQVSLKGETGSAWVSENGTDASMRWLRPIFLKVTDPRFQKGGRPAVDLEITFHNPGYGSVRVKADTEGGPRQIGAQWGNTKEWRTMRVALDDAFFGGRAHDGDAKPLLNGFDLRIDGINGPFYLKRIRLIGYNPTENVVWSRMIKTTSPVSPGPGGVMAFAKSERSRIDVELANVARVERPVFYRLQIAGYDDRVRYRVEDRLVLGASGKAVIPFVFDTREWPLGPYDGRLELFTGASRTRPVYTRTFRLGMVDGGEIGKARPGEFLYGLDAANFTHYPILTPAAFAYYRLMGVDILRCPYDTGMKETLADVGRALETLAAEGVRSALVVDPPKDTDAGKRAAQLKPKLEFIEAVARRFTGEGPGRIRFWEMGNEPDLTHFYPAEIPDYIESYHQMYDAVKRGARAAGMSDSDSVVMNGGLSFAGAAGARRAAEFVEKVDAAKLDAIGYHGHGAGIEAERSAYERLQRVAKEHGKDHLPFIETESGLSGVDRVGLAEQARTVVEKMTYAQSKGAPLFIYFRLFMEGSGVEGGYTMAEKFVEPRPSVLSYRNMVRHLRHHRFVTAPDFAADAGAAGVTAFLFEEIDEKGAATGRKTLVAFCEKTASHELRFGLDRPGSNVAAAGFDLYGNPVPVEVDQSVATFTVGVDPVYLTWTSSGSSGDARVMPPLLSADASEPLLPGARNLLPVVVRNPRTDHPLEVELEFSATTRLATTVEPKSAKVTVPAGGSLRVPFVLTLGAADSPLSMPGWWTVFTDVDLAAIAPAALASIPDTLPASGGGAPAAGRAFASPGGRLNFGAIAGGVGDTRAGVAYAYIDSPRAVEMECGATGDWYMAWYLNGEKVQDTLTTGNGQHGPVSLHPFTLKLRKGRNVIAVALRSGRHGWDVRFGGPKELRIARTAGDDPDTVAVVMKAPDGRVLSSLKEPLTLAAAIPELGGSSALRPEDWTRLEPLATLGSDSVENFWVKEPDQSRWYRGEADLSAGVWLREDGERLLLFVAVKDDKLVQAPSADALAQHDGVRALITDEAGRPLLDVMGGLSGDRAVISGGVAGQEFKAVRREGSDGVTYYQFGFPAALVGTTPFRVNLQVTDNDAGYLRQVAELGSVKNPERGIRVILRQK